MKSLILAGLALMAAASARPEDPRAGLDAIAPRLLQQTAVPSVSVAKIRRGRIVFAAAYGVQSGRRPATAATLYNIASLTKPITAEVVLRLAARGKFDLDERMDRTWLDPDIAGDPRHRLLTPRLALSHRAGFPNWRRETGGRLAFLRAPGEGYGYSGEGYAYVARFAELRCGADLERLAEAQVFSPAGMTETSYVAQSWFAGRIAPPTAADGRTLAPEIARTPVAADEAYSTARDCARFLTSLIRGQRLTPSIERQRRIVQSDRRGELCAGGKAASCPGSVGPGLGWEVSTFGARVFLMHTGADRGVFTFAYFSPTTGEGAVIFTNGARGAELILPILDRIGADRDFLGYLHGQVEN